MDAPYHAIILCLSLYLEWQFLPSIRRCYCSAGVLEYFVQFAAGSYEWVWFDSVLSALQHFWAVAAR